MSRYRYGIIELADEQKKSLCEDTRLTRLGDVYGSFSIEYGFDHACGYFLQLFPRSEEANNCLEDMGVEECIDMDSLFGGITGSDLGYFLNLIKGNKEHVDACFMDLPF